MAKSRRRLARSTCLRKCHFQKLEPRLPLSAEPIITEFLASNNDSLLDDNGNSSDWVEIFNAGDQAIDLAGHTLTDDPAQIDKWAFPAYTLQPHRYLVVFAGVDSDLNQGTDLYTGFSLRADGEYLGLYDPSGSLLSEFEANGANYPLQHEDISYGLESEETQTTALATGDNSQYLVPNATTGALLSDAWRQPDYVLGTYGENWRNGPSGFGYENGSGYEPYISTDVGSEMFGNSSSLYIRSAFEQDPSAPIDTLRLRAQYDDGFIAYLNGVEVLRANGPAVDASDVSTIELDNLFDDPKGASLEAALASDTYQAVAESSDLGVYKVIDGGLNTSQTIAPGVVFNLSNAGGGDHAVGGGPSNDTFRSISTGAIRTTGVSNPPETKIEDGIGMHADELLTFDIDELRTAAGFPGADGYFTARTGLNDTAGGLGSVKTIAILSDANGQVVAGYVNGQRVEVSKSAGVWSFSGDQPGVFTGAGTARLGQIAAPVPASAKYLTLAVTSNGSPNSDHGVFSGAKLEFNAIALGNLFDDPHGTALTAALATDAPQARADIADLGVVATVDGNFQSTQTIAPSVEFDLSNVGSSTSSDGVGASNDAWSTDSDQPIRTRNVGFTGLNGIVAEDGVGLPADELVTFDVEELRAAGAFSSDAEFRFKSRVSLNDTAQESAAGLGIVLASDSFGNVVGAWVNGEVTPAINHNSVWQLDFAGGAPTELTADSSAIDLDLALPSNTAYLTLIGAGGASTSFADQIVFSGARLQATPDADGVSWESTSGGGHDDSEAVQFQEFDLSKYVGLLKNGTNVLAIHALNASSTSSDCLFSHEIVTGVLGYVPGSRRYFTNPTPEAVNNLGVAGIVENVSFSVGRGFYNSPISVAITTPTADSDIYYTTDASLPTPDNPTATLYTGAVAVSGTTNLRAAAYHDDYAPSYIDTETYVFVDDVLRQDPRNDYGNGVSPNDGLVYPDTWDSGVTGDYGMDPDVVAQWDDNNPNNLDIGIRESLLAIPTFSLTLDHGDAWRSLSDDFPGILTNARNRGEGFRHAASIEYFDPATGETFQANAAVQAQGNSSRSSGSTRQHSYRLIFDKTLGGPGKLNFPLFDNSDFANINTFTLKVASTDGFSHDSRTNGSTINPLNSTYTRDAFIRQLHFNTGNPAADSTFAHVYINGLYWGLYIPIERPDDAFFADRFGGEREDWDVFRDNDEFISGNSAAWNQMKDLISQIGSASPTQANVLFQQIQGKNPDGSDNPNIEALMDVDNFIDYYAIHLSSNVNDWPHRNWYAARNRENPGDGFQFIAWDQGQSLAQDFIDRTERQGGLGTLHHQLLNCEEYRLRFADRIQEHFFHDGALTLAAQQETWTELNNKVEKAIVAETARWGDSREGEYSNAFGASNPPPGAPQHPLYPPGFATTVPTLTINNWRTNVNFVHDEVLPFGRPLFFQRMLDDGLMSPLSGPEFAVNGSDQYGGLINPNDSLAINLTDSGTVYYTTDGSDPRLPGGAIHGLKYASPITLNASTLVKARTFSAGEWSALSGATFTLPEGTLAISEINYHPYDPTSSEFAAGFTDEDDFEFIEIVNRSTTDAINLAGSQLSGGVTYSFGHVELAPGERAVVLRDAAAFAERYGSGVNVLGEWSGGLSNSGEELVLLDDLGGEIQSVEYADSDPWSITADNDGATLVLDETAPENQLGKWYRWRGSVEFGGTPGGPSAAPAGVVINEVLARTASPQIDAIELYNPTAGDVNLGGWFLSDAGGNLLKFQIPANTILDAGEYLVFDETDFNAGASAFALDGLGDQVYLVNPNGANGLEFVDAVEFGGDFNGMSLGRLPNGSGRLAPLASPTLGAANSAAQIGPLVISEVNYHPSNPSSAAQAAFSALATPSDTLSDDDLEFVEIHNPSPASVNLTNWGVRGDADYDFASGTVLAAGETLVVVTFDPTTDPARLAGFRTQYGIGEEATVVGGLDSHLNNSFARVELRQPDYSDPQEIASVTADEVLFDDLAPWDATADGSGNSLHRTAASACGNYAASWSGAAPTPGAVEFADDGDFDDDGDTDGFDFLAWQRGFGATYGAQDLNDWQANYGASAASLPATAASVSVAAPEFSQSLPLGAWIISPTDRAPSVRQPEVVVEQRYKAFDAAFAVREVHPLASSVRDEQFLHDRPLRTQAADRAFGSWSRFQHSLEAILPQIAKGLPKGGRS